MSISAFDAAVRKEIMDDVEQSPSYLGRELAKIARAEQKAEEQRARRDLLEAIRKSEVIEVTPQAVNVLRSRVFRIIDHSLLDAALVMTGQKVWSGSQIQLFRTLINKVLPDLHHSAGQVTVETRPLNELSRAELEAIVAQNAKAQAALESAIESVIPDSSATSTPSSSSK